MSSCFLRPPTLRDDGVKRSVVDGQSSPRDLKRKRQEPTAFPSSKLMLLALSSSDRIQPLQPKPRFKRGEEEKAKMMEWVESQERHQRETSRLRQIRHRKKKDAYCAQLEEETRQIEQQIQKLERRSRAVSTATPLEQTLWQVAVEYFRLFRFGTRGDAEQCVQLDFLRATMATDVLFNAGRGLESVSRNWKYFTLWFRDVEVELNGLKKGGYSRSCAARKEGTAGSPLADKLLGQRIVMRGVTRFDWDAGYGRVTSVTSESDMLTPMLRILGSLEDVSRVFKGSLISLTPYRGQYRH
ncbi:hypothetical protein PHYPSEUDO_012210 [Phytophthora pseudosyringae]|uniref:Bzip transcription factor n=1 Tax=Phytophthora pseudosyringae TaxID=221518 RepID=A0A8T1W8W2_9STRA|nr:hypothetical protein PHYPSEUDO_012210 [Phytophthora pseudosyringae]